MFYHKIFMFLQIVKQEQITETWHLYTNNDCTNGGIEFKTQN